MKTKQVKKQTAALRNKHYQSLPVQVRLDLQRMGKHSDETRQSKRLISQGAK